MASCMECIHFNPCNSHGKIIVEKTTEGNDWRLHNNVENECKYFAPTADVVEVKHGEWLHKNGEMICSVCGAEALMDEVYYESPFCPDCGALMDGGKINGNV